MTIKSLRYPSGSGRYRKLLIKFAFGDLLDGLGSSLFMEIVKHVIRNEYETENYCDGNRGKFGQLFSVKEDKTVVFNGLHNHDTFHH